MASNRKLLELAAQAVTWLHLLAPKAENAETKAEVQKLANDLNDCVNGCPSCGSPSSGCPCERDE